MNKTRLVPRAQTDTTVMDRHFFGCSKTYYEKWVSRDNGILEYGDKKFEDLPEIPDYWNDVGVQFEELRSKPVYPVMGGTPSLKEAAKILGKIRYVKKKNPVLESEDEPMAVNDVFKEYGVLMGACWIYHKSDEEIELQIGTGKKDSKIGQEIYEKYTACFNPFIERGFQTISKKALILPETKKTIKNLEKDMFMLDRAGAAATLTLSKKYEALRNPRTSEILCDYMNDIMDLRLRDMLFLSIAVSDLEKTDYLNETENAMQLLSELSKKGELSFADIL